MEVQLSEQAISDSIEAALPSHSQSSSSSATSASKTTVKVTSIPAALIDLTFSSSTNLTTTVLGAQTLATSNDFFAEASNLLNPIPAVFDPLAFNPKGKTMDGWESKRHNPNPFDWVVIKLGCVGTVDAVEVDTSHFNGNEAPAAGLDGCFLPETDDKKKTKGEPEVVKEDFSGWTEILPPQKCGPSQRQAWKVSGPGVSGREFTHLRIKQYPDGGIARLRVYGSVRSPPLPLSVTQGGAERPLEDLAAALNGGVAVASSDQHFGVKSNLILPGRGVNMGDGWETARSRTKGHHDWAIIRLGLKGKMVEKIVIDTKDFCGNYPQSVMVDGWSVESAKAALGTEDEPKHDSLGWTSLIANGERPTQADSEHTFEKQDLVFQGPQEGRVWTHVKLTIRPDGGVKRLRIFGRRA